MGLGLSPSAEWLGVGIAALGFLFAWRELHRSAKVQRAQFLLDATQRYFGDQEVRKLYYELDYNALTLQFDDGQPSQLLRRESSSESKFLGSDDERHLDSLLYTLDTIGRIVELKLLRSKDAVVFAFQARRVLDNSEVKKYLDWLDDERKRLGGERPPHRAARLLADLARTRSS